MKDSSVIVTGGAGFIGTNLAEKLIEMGNSVLVIDNLSVTNKNIPFLRKIGADIQITDISDFDKIKNLFKNIDCVFHLAAMNRAQRSIENPLLSNKWNIDGTLNVLEASRMNNVPRLINISSSSVYARKKELLKENDNVKPLHPYGVGKLAGEHYTRIYCELYGLKTTTLRYFSVYGPRQLGNIEKAGVIAKFIHNIKNQLPIEVYGDGKQTRNFTYVSDAVKVTIDAINNPRAVGETFNIASEKEIQVNEVISLIEKHLGKKAKVKYISRLKGDPLNNPGDITKAKETLDFHPFVDIDEGISKTAGWHNENN